MLINTVAAVSLLLFVATVGIWVRSYGYVDLLGNGVVNVNSQRGAVTFLWHVRPPWPAINRWIWNQALLGAEPEPFFKVKRWSLLGIEGGDDVYGGTKSVSKHYLLVPHWAFCLLELVLPAAWLAHRLRSRPRQIGLCLNCDYDLRASKGRCPECGTPIATKTETMM